LAAVAVICASLALPVRAQEGGPARPDWRRTGNTNILLGLPSPAGGPVERVWFDAGTGLLLARTGSGGVYSTADFESWTAAAAEPAAIDETRIPPGARPPEGAARLFVAAGDRTRLYAAGAHLWRSRDGGATWTNVTFWRGTSLLGAPVRDVAVDPGDPDRIAAATGTGLWMSADGGDTWRGLNGGLPNLPVRRIVAPPHGARGMRIAYAATPDDEPRELEWAPGEKEGWAPARAGLLDAERDLRDALEAMLGVRPSALAVTPESLYAGAGGGRLWASLDAGRTWRQFQAPQPAGRVERIWTDAADARFALAVLSGAEGGGGRVLRTMNAGAYWDDITAGLPEGGWYGVAASREAGVIYAAGERGVFYTLADLRAPGPATPWTALPGPVPGAPAVDVRLDEAGLQLFVAVAGHGVFAAPAPHRGRQPLLVHSSDYARRAAAPGALLSLVGAMATEATVNRAAAPVLSSTRSETQFQVPFEAAGTSAQVVLAGGGGRWEFPMPLHAAAPSILVDREGAPVFVDAATGVQVDLMNPARPGMRLQVLAAGLGRVRPAWPTGLPAPLENPPVVEASLRALLDGTPVEVVRATLAPGYIGYYLVELQLPEFLDEGASELYLEAAGQASNRVRLYAGR
jgi:uncharacterized protein (TIGR03437 family)